MQFTIYRDESRKNIIEKLLNSNLINDPPIVSTKKNIIENIASFLVDIKLNIVLSDGFKINKIRLLNGKILPSINNKISSLIQHFNIRTSYVATIDKKVLNDIRNFYQKLENVEIKPEETIIFDVSHEKNLQRVLSEQQFKSNNNVISAPIVENSEKQPFVSTEFVNNQAVLEPFSTEIVEMQPQKENNKKNKVAGYIAFALLGTLGAAILVFASISIGVKIMNM